MAFTPSSTPPVPPSFGGRTVDGVKLKTVYSDKFKSIDWNLWECRFPWDKQKNPMGKNGKQGRYIGEEEQIYLDPALGDPNPFTPSGQGLDIHGWRLTEDQIADHLDRMRAEGNEDTEEGYWGYRYGSGMLSGAKSLGQTYGYFEFCLRTDYWNDKDIGNFSAAWLCKLKDHAADPPDLGKDEIDLQETIGGDTADGKLKPRSYQTVHYGQEGDADMVQFVHKNGFDPALYHLVGCLWTADFVKLYMDDVLALDYPNPPPGDPYGLHAPQFPILNQAIGGRWPGDVEADPGPEYDSHTNFAWYRQWKLK